MKRALVTGAKGFIGRNLTTHLKRLDDLAVFLYDVENEENDLKAWLNQADVAYHLAGINRPKSVGEHETGNAGFTTHVCETLRQLGKTPKIVTSSSIQAELDNPYGISKQRAEGALRRFARETRAAVSIYRLKNVFGKWCRPNYNSVTATFCHNIAHDLPISISDPAREVELVYIADVVESLVDELSDCRTVAPSGCKVGDQRLEVGLSKEVTPSYRITLGDLAGRVQAFHEMKTGLMTPDFSDRFNQCLYASTRSRDAAKKFHEAVILDWRDLG